MTSCGTKKYEIIDTNKALELIENVAVIIDVRTASEYAERHIKDAINIPLDMLNSIDYDKETTLIVYCATGIRSKEAAEKLSQLGYSSLYDLDWKLINWGSALE